MVLVLKSHSIPVCLNKEIRTSRNIWSSESGELIRNFMETMIAQNSGTVQLRHKVKRVLSQDTAKTRSRYYLIRIFPFSLSRQQNYEALSDCECTSSHLTFKDFKLQSVCIFFMGSDSAIFIFDPLFPLRIGPF